MSLAEERKSHLSVVEEDERAPFAAFLSDDETLAAARAMAARRGWSKGEVQGGGLAAALRQLGIVSSPELLLVDLSEASDIDDALTGLAELASGGRVVALGLRNDVEMFRKALDAGAVDYLVKPVDPDVLERAIERAEQGGRTGSGVAARRQGRCIAFVGARGGVGASSLAANTAWLIAEERKRRVALIDLDLHFGTLALTLDLEAGSGLREALEDPERVDEIFLDRAAVPMGERLVLLAAEEPIDDALQLSGTALGQVIGELRERHDLLVLDLPRAVLGQSPGMLAELTDIVVVTDLTLAGLRDSNRLMRFLKAQECKARKRVVAGRVTKGDKGQLSVGEFARELDGTLDLKLAEDPSAMAKAALAGKPLAEVAANSRLLKDLRALTSELVGEPKKKRSLFEGIFGKAKT